MLALMHGVCSYAVIIDSGKCGDNVTWELDDNGLLTISGTGDMYDYDVGGAAPWMRNWSEISKVSILDGVLKIGNYAFDGCFELKIVELPNSLTKIGGSAFKDCQRLALVTIPNSVAEIGNYAFCNCSLTSIDIPSSVTTIGRGAFCDCRSLTSIEIPNSVTAISDYAFSFCSSLSSVYISNSVTEVGNSAFYWCKKLREIKCDAAEPPVCGNDDFGSEGVFIGVNPRTCKLYVSEQSVDKYRAADQWKDFKNITYALDSGSCGDSITWTLDADHNLTLIGTGEMCDYDQGAPWGNSVVEVSILDGITELGSHAFSGCSELTSVVIPVSIELIGDNAFSGCIKLAEIDCKAVKPPKCGADVFDSRCTNLCKLYVPQSSLRLYGVVDVWEDFNFVSGSTIASSGECGDNVIWTLDYDGNLTISGTGRMDDIYYTAWDASQVMFVTISDGITNIGSRAFKGCENLVGVELPNSVTEIGTYAFSECSSLTRVIIPSSVTTIRGSAFYGCRSLTCVSIPTSVTAIGNYAFSGCRSLTCVSIPASVTTIGNWAFSSCSSLTSVIIPNSVTEIGNAAFGSCISLDEIQVAEDNNIYDSRGGCNAVIKTATNTLIAGCKNTTIPNTVTTIGRSAFVGCSSLTSVEIPNTVSEIGKGAFGVCESLTEIKCEAVEPPSCDGDVFYGVNTTDCKLYVSEESIEKYQTADVWKGFSNIIGFAGVDDVMADSEVAVNVTGNTLVVEGADAGEMLEVYSAAGATVYRGPATTVALPGSGIYFVKIAGKILKLAVN